MKSEELKMESEDLFAERQYSDIIDLPHHVSKKHPQMSMYQRAAQFAPFAALVGHDKAIKETAKQNEKSFIDK